MLNKGHLSAPGEFLVHRITSTSLLLPVSCILLLPPGLPMLVPPLSRDSTAWPCDLHSPRPTTSWVQILTFWVQIGKLGSLTLPDCTSSPKYRKWILVNCQLVELLLIQNVCRLCALNLRLPVKKTGSQRRYLGTGRNSASGRIQSLGRPKRGWLGLPEASRVVLGLPLHLLGFIFPTAS